MPPKRRPHGEEEDDELYEMEGFEELEDDFDLEDNDITLEDDGWEELDDGDFEDEVI